MKMLAEDIKNGSFKTSYLLYGEEAYLRSQYKNKLKEALVNPDDTMNFSRFEGKGTDPAEIISLADTLPFFADRRLILIEDSGFFKNKCDELADYIPKLPDTTCLLFVETEVDKRSRLYKAVQKYGRTTEFQLQDERTLMRWILGTLKKENKKITEDTLRSFLARTGSDMENIHMELEKLLSYTIGRDVITAEDVEAICTMQITGQIFEMIRAIAEKKQRQALDLYYDLLALKEPPMRILFLIARQFNQLLLVKSLASRGLDRSAIASKAQVAPFIAGRLMTQAKSFTAAQLRAALPPGMELELVPAAVCRCWLQWRRLPVAYDRYWRKWLWDGAFRLANPGVCDDFEGKVASSPEIMQWLHDHWAEEVTPENIFDLWGGTNGFDATE